MTDLNAQKLIKKLAQDLDIYMGEKKISKPIFIGIRTGGFYDSRQQFPPRD